MNYSYSKGDLLTSRNTYFYTPYEGFNFLEAWKKDRDKSASILGSRIEPPLIKVKTTLKSFAEKISLGKTVATELLLDTLYKSLADESEEATQDVYLLTNKLVKRFEVTKRIHEEYGLGFRAVDKEKYYNLGLYIRAAEVFECAYSLSKELPYLNVLLKCVDTLCAVYEKFDSNQKGRIAWLIYREKHHISKLASTINIKL
ncbi:hypothetical protein HN803_03480 [candidate division WWE3 bacterium]|jgi:hypothetical protein|nr:hypothetical protein [candidate division WWE3 bacterium]